MGGTIAMATVGQLAVGVGSWQAAVGSWQAAVGSRSLVKTKKFMEFVAINFFIYKISIRS